MRSKIAGIVLGCALAAATVLPSLACNFRPQASNDQPPQQTAQAQTSETKAQ